LQGSQPDADLVHRARRGDPHSFVTLCERHRPRLWRIASSVAKGADAEDLAQEAVIRAFRAFGSYLGEAPFEAWLCRIAVNVAHDYLRSAWKRKVLLFEETPADESGPTQTPEGEAERREVQRRVRQAVAKLPEPQRSPIWLHFFEGFSVAEVARLEQTPEATVRSRLKAGLKRLSHSLHDLVPVDAPLPLEPEAKGCSA
jgi:RNA polymerase sigma-70 factor (ECF subfamily)